MSCEVDSCLLKSLEGLRIPTESDQAFYVARPQRSRSRVFVISFRKDLQRSLKNHCKGLSKPIAKGVRMSLSKN
jgi:hypothetical protein